MSFVYSDALCGSLYCDTSAIANLQYVSFGTPFTESSGCITDNGDVICVTAEYLSFYNGPGRPDPGLVPDGAACGTGKVTTLNDYTFLFIY